MEIGYSKPSEEDYVKDTEHNFDGKEKTVDFILFGDFVYSLRTTIYVVLFSIIKMSNEFRRENSMTNMQMPIIKKAEINYPDPWVRPYGGKSVAHHGSHYNLLVKSGMKEYF